MARRIRRRLHVLLITLGLVAAGVVVDASPAAAAVTRSFTGPTIISGSATFINSYTVRVSVRVYGDKTGPGYVVKGAYFGEVGTYVCLSREHYNRNPGRTITYTDTLECGIANIQEVQVVYINNGRYAGETDYIANPLA